MMKISRYLIPVTVLALFVSCNAANAETPTPATTTTTTTPAPTKVAKKTTNEGTKMTMKIADKVTDLITNDLKVGDGAEAKTGSTVVVHYTGWLPKDGTARGSEFDSSKNHGPFSFKLGENRVIQGWEKGVLGMKVHGKRELTIPPQLGYGARGAGATIPPNATLFFEVELLEVK